MPEQSPGSLAHPRHWPAWFGVSLLSLLAQLPLPVLAVVGRGIGRSLYYLHPRRRHIVNVNLALCFPDLSNQERARLARQHFAALGQGFFDATLAWWAPVRRLRRLVHFVDREHYDRALATGRRVILFAPHFVALEMTILVARERLTATMYKNSKSDVVNWVMRRRRVRHGGIVIEKGEGLRRMVSALRQGAVFCYLPDQDPGRDYAVFAPFFGVSAATLAVLGRLAQMTDAIVVPVHARQLPWGRGYDLIFRPPFADADLATPEACAARVNREIEEVTRLMPEQYFWAHKRFKTRPAGEQAVY